MGKIFCRIYQGIMKIGMYFLPWKMPEVLEGAGCIRRLPAVIRQKGYKNVLIVTDAMLVKLHLLDALIEALDKEQVHYTLLTALSQILRISTLKPASHFIKTMPVMP